MDNKYENIVPWNGANDTGKDVRLKWKRNFAKIGANFDEVFNKLGTADELFELIADELAKRLRKDKDDRTDHSLEVGGDLTVEGLLQALGGISVGDKGSITSDGIATLQILKALVRAEVKALSVSGAASVGSLDSEGNISTGADVLAKGTVHSLNSVVQALSRTHDLTVEQTADIMHQIIHEYISSNKFVSGFLGEGFKVWKDDAGLWHGELDMLTVRKVFTVFELVVQKVVHQGGMVIRSAAGGKITKVTDGGSYWRCEHDSTDDFVANDQVLCQVFTGTKMKRYWRLVTSAGAGYFNLSKTDCEAGSAIPEAGDDVAVLGNRTNATRQSAQIDCAVGADAPYRDDYAGINSYSLSGKLVTRTGNLSGITDDDFGPLSGSGLYGRNVYLKGVFRLLSGKTVDAALEEIKRQSDAARDSADASARSVAVIRTELSAVPGKIKAAVNETKLYADQSAANKANAALEVAKSYTNSEISVINGKIDLKVSKSDFNSLGTRVSSCESRITQTENSIRLKADQSTVNGIHSRLQSAEAKITPDAIKFTVKSQTEAIAASAAKRTEVWIDARGLDQSKYYPVTINLSVGIPMYTITVDRVLDVNRGKPSWSTHPGGFSVLCRWRTNASGWGTIGVQRIILDYTYAHCSVLPAGSIGQLTHGSLEYIYVRGGSMYHVMAEGATDTNISLHTSAYTWSSGQYSQKLDILTSVDAPVPDLSQRPTVDEIKSQFTIDTGGISMLGKKISLAGMVTFSSFDTSAQAVINGKATPAQVAAAKSEAISAASSDATTKANSAKSAAISAAASDASNKANNALNGAKGYTDQLKTTIIDGDYIKTTLIRAGSITADKIMVGSITGDRIMAGSITADKLKAGSITADKINVSSVQSAVVTAEKIAALSITTGNLTVTTGAKIGGWAIEGNALKITQAAGAKILVEPSGTRFLRINDETAKLMSVRADGVTGIYIYTQDTAGKCLMTIAQTGGKAIESYGNCIFTARTGELIDFVGSTRIGGLSVKAVRTSSFYTCSNDDTWITCTNSSHINITLPASPTPGKVIYIKKDSGGGVGIRGNGKSIRCNQDYRTEIYIPGFNIARLVYDGAYWQAMCSWWTDS